MNHWQRKSILIVGGVGAAAVLLLHREMRSPAMAPPDVAAAGYALIRDEVAKVAATDFGRSSRGRMLITAVDSLLDKRRVAFSATMGGPRAQMRWRPLRGWWLYVRALQPNERTWLHQLPWQVAESVFHEAVHHVQGGIGAPSFEEECDAFCAGLYAEAASQGVPAPDRLTIDGLTVAAFVRQAYPEARRNRRYQPVGKDLAWLRQRAEIDD